MQNGYGVQRYNQAEIMSADPVRLVAMVYDYAIEACEYKDFNRATKTVSVLRDALDHDYSAVAVDLFGNFQWCLECIRREDYDDALLTLRELRASWGIVETKLTPPLQKS